MSRIRESVVNQIYEALDKGSLGRANFDFTFPKTGRTLVKIRMIQYPEYRFEIGESSSSPLRLYANEYPGDVLKEETHAGLDLDTMLDRLEDWDYRLLEELSVRQQDHSDFEGLLKRLEKEIDENVENPESQFSGIEIQELREKLNNLSTRFEELQKRNEITEAELAELKKQLELSSGNLPDLPKGVWYRASMNRIVTTMRKIVMSKEGREILSSAVKKLIGLE